jgi:putative ATP-dependent endonuclease of OLD family
MKIDHIIIKGFRSIKEVALDLSQLNIIVGQNNHGKTNFMEALDWFFNAKGSGNELKHCLNPSEEIFVELHYSGVQEELNGMKNAKNAASIKKMIGESEKVIVRKSSRDHKRQIIVEDAPLGNPTGFDAALNDFLPKLEYVSTKIHLNDVSQFKSNSPIGKMLSGVLGAIIETSPKYLEFKEKFTELFGKEDSEIRIELNKLGKSVEVFLQKQFPDGTEVIFDVASPDFDDLLKNFETEIDDGIQTKAEDKGDGMQRAVMLAIIQAYADFRKISGHGKSFLFMIDEAELHLHPAGQRSLKGALQDISKNGDQVIINTHSSVLVAEEEPEQSIFRVHKENKVTSILPIGPQEKYEVVFELLGGSPSDLLFPNNFIIVEGKSDYFFLREIFNRHFPEAKGLHVIWGGGNISEQEESLHGIYKCLVPLITSPNPLYKDKVIIIHDHPADAREEHKLNQFKTGHPYLFSNNQVFGLPHKCIEEYYPSPWKKTYEESRTDEFKRQKVEYARRVGQAISIDDLEIHMPIYLSAIHKCLELKFP